MTQTPREALNPDGEIFLVGDLRVDVGQQRVMRGADEIHLPNLSFQLLTAMIRAAPNVVSNDLLMESVWPGLVVSPETVAKRVNLLREALGDSANEPKYIVGVRSRGYRLVAPVSSAPATTIPQTVPSVADSIGPAFEVAPSTAPAPSPASANEGHRRWVWVSVPLVLIAVLLTAFFVIRSRTAPEAVGNAGIVARGDIAEARERTVAVVPFDNMSADAADAYLGQGLPEMILNRLSQVTGLSVIARGSSFAPALKTMDPRELGRRLNSAYVVDGSVQRKADRLRVAVQLVDCTSGTLLWSSHFDRDLNDIFALEDEIAEQVTDALSARLGALDPKPVARMRRSNIEAYLAYLRGRTLLGRFSVAESESAAPYFEKAIALDPNFAEAYASLYDARLQAAHLRHEDLAPVRQRSRPLIDRALAIDPDSGAAHFARAMWADAPFETRNADFLRGVALDPSNGRGLTAYAEFLDYEDFGWVQASNSNANYPVQREEAKRILQRALQIDPMSPGAHFDAATGGDEGGAIEQKMQSVLELDPEFVPALFQVGKYRWFFHGKLTEAVQILEHAIALDPHNPEPRQIAMAVYLDLGDEQAARTVAAATPHSARDLRLLFMYAGDWRAAGPAAYDAGQEEDCGTRLGNEAARDYALKTGELSRAIAFVKAINYFENDPAAQLDACNNHGALVLSQLLAAHGETREAQELRRAVVSWSDANAVKSGGGIRRIAAEAMLLDGRKEAALDKLAEDFRAGDYPFWWYTLKYDPVWLPLHGDPRFQQIAADVQLYVDAQRRELETLRQQGDVPRRGTSAPTH